MKYIFILLFGIICSFTFAQSDSINNTSISGQKERIEIKFPEKLIIEQTIPQVIEDKFWVKSIPWLIALFIGISTVLVNLYLSKKLRQSAEKNLNLQLKNSKEITLAQLKGTIATKNRQEWINEVRHSVTEILTHSLFLIADYDTEDKKADKLEKIIFAKSKIELLTNDAKPDQKELVDKIQELIKEIGLGSNDFDENRIINKREDIINISRKIFKIHWNKIKNLE
ncbi:MAG: hypothetical protein ACJAVA_002732 [Flavobacteriaceae bacterium]|jgi:hypothetical protein